MNKKSYICYVALLLLFLSCSISCSGKKSKDMKSSEIISLIKKGKDVSVSDKVIFGDLDFTEIEKNRLLAFPNVEVRIPVNVVFMNCVFMGKVTMSAQKAVDKSKRKANLFSVFEKNVTFFGCDFRGEVAMDEAIVEGKLEFSNSTFREDVSMNSLYVKGARVGFLNVVGEKRFSMCYARFLSDANFMDAKFAAEANFLGMNAKGLQFSNAEFLGNTDFSNAAFLGDVIFNYVRFASVVQFSFSKFLGDFDLVKSSFEGDASFERSFFFGRLRMQKSHFKARVETKDVKSFVMPDTAAAVFPSDTLQWRVVSSAPVELK